jgi:hypothetical protein
MMRCVVTLIALTCAPAYGQTFSVRNAYTLQGQPEDVLSALMQHAKQVELSPRIPRTDMNLRIGIEYFTRPNRGRVYAETLESITPMRLVTAERIYYEAQFAFVRGAVQVDSHLTASIAINCGLIQAVVNRGRRVYQRVAEQAWASLAAVLAGNEATFRSIVGA